MDITAQELELIQALRANDGMTGAVLKLATAVSDVCPDQLAQPTVSSKRSDYDKEEIVALDVFSLLAREGFLDVAIVDTEGIGNVVRMMAAVVETSIASMSFDRDQRLKDLYEAADWYSIHKNKIEREAQD